MGREVLASIRTQYPSFTPVERTIADYVLNHGAKVVRLPIRQLAYECAVGESSIVRFCKRVGQGKGYPDFRHFAVGGAGNGKRSGGKGRKYFFDRRGG